MKVLLLLLLAAPVGAETRIELPNHTARQVADVASWATVATAMALDVQASWKCSDRVRCFELQGARIGVGQIAVFVAKLTVKRMRPCAPDCGIDNPNYSFFSGHTTLAFQTIGGAKLQVSIPLAASTGALRVAAGKHWVSDVLMGAGVGLLTSRIR